MARSLLKRLWCAAIGALVPAAVKSTPIEPQPRPASRAPAVPLPAPSRHRRRGRGFRWRPYTRGNKILRRIERGAGGIYRNL